MELILPLLPTVKKRTAQTRLLPGIAHSPRMLLHLGERETL